MKIMGTFSLFYSFRKKMFCSHSSVKSLVAEQPGIVVDAVRAWLWKLARTKENIMKLFRCLSFSYWQGILDIYFSPFPSIFLDILAFLVFFEWWVLPAASRSCACCSFSPISFGFAHISLRKGLSWLSYVRGPSSVILHSLIRLHFAS